MIRFSEIITTFAFELERHEKTCRDEDSHEYRAFCNYPITGMWKFQYQKDDGNAAHAWDYCTLLTGNDIPHSVGYCILLLIGSFHNLSYGKCNSSHAIFFIVY